MIHHGGSRESRRNPRVKHYDVGQFALTRSWYLSRSSLLKSERLYSERRSLLVDLTFFILESSAKVEEVTQGQLPAGKEIGSEDLIARQGCVHQVLPPLEFQNLHRFSL